ncbi:EcsC family protein [Mycetohabitans sp. B46]|uniref:EcsC family protein n=1 Tax=Mycetohabitans sp. B46 TaxID=2772536 RepID=UPI00307EA404
MSNALTAPSNATLRDADLKALHRARQLLERPGLAIKLTSVLGAPFEALLSRLPAGANDKVLDATHIALRRCLRAALHSLGHRDSALPLSTEYDPMMADAGARPATLEAIAAPRPRNWLHKVAVATTGAAGGAFGLVALPIELPVTTTLMFRSICDIARSEGEDLSTLDVQLECLSVLAMGHTAIGPGRAEMGYFFVRGALAQAVSKASSDVAAKGFAHGMAAQASSALARLINAVAARFSVQVGEQLAAKSVPALGAVLGALVNAAFIEHFQNMAHAHFTVRRLERRYGEPAVRAAYEAIARHAP